MSDAELRKLALAATDGPWEAKHVGDIDLFPMSIIARAADFEIANYVGRGNAAYIAAAHQAQAHCRFELPLRP